MPDSSLVLSVNGESQSLALHPMTRLLDALRVNLGLTGVKEGCGEGECGACSVLIDGELVNSCLVPVAQAAGRDVLTIEGVAGRYDGLQQAFLQAGAAQCGICTPGMVLAAIELSQRTKNPNETEIREALAGNICRCTGYMKIVEAVANYCHEARGGDEG